MQRSFTTAGLALAAILTAVTLSGPQPSRAAGRGEHSIVGTWFIRAVIPGQPLPIGAIYTFNQDGALLAARTGAEFTSGQGRWERTGARKYGATVLYLRQEANGDYKGTMKARQNWTLSADGQQLSTHFHNDFYDLNGNLERSAEGDATATRVKVEPLP